MRRWERGSKRPWTRRDAQKSGDLLRQAAEFLERFEREIKQLPVRLRSLRLKKIKKGEAGSDLYFLAQNFEDVALWAGLEAITGLASTSMIGAKHRSIDSVTRSIVERGWRGSKTSRPVQRYSRKLCVPLAPRDVQILVRAVGSKDAGELTVFFEVSETGSLTPLPEMAGPAIRRRHLFYARKVNLPRTFGLLMRGKTLFRRPAGIFSFFKIDVGGLLRKQVYARGMDFQEGGRREFLGRGRYPITEPDWGNH